MQGMQLTAQKIDPLQVTRDTLTSRGGLTFLVKYVEAIGILTLLLNRFAKIQERPRSIGGQSVLTGAVLLLRRSPGGTCVISTSCSETRATGP
jgi:hypothetical protein